MKRREFIQRVAQTTAVVSATALSTSRVLGANERVGIGVIGCGLIGRIHARSFVSLPGAQVVAVADTHQPRLDAAQMTVGGGAKLYRDFRRLLEDKSVDAVVVATPDHWHALQTMMACAAGKDVYVEKPVSLFAREGRWMMDVARRHKRVVQVGTQQRSGPHYQRARELLRGGAIGDIVSVQVNYFRNVAPGFGNPPDGAPPPELDYDLWLGPAPQRAYNPNRALYHFRWFWDYSGGQMTNLGHHSLDIVHWVTGVKGPRAVTCAGGRHFLKDNCEVPDVQDAILEYPGFQTTVQFRECAGGMMNTATAGMIFQGTKGSMVLNRMGFEIVPDKKENPVNIVARIMGGHPVGGAQPIAEPEGQLWTEALKDTSGDSKKQLVDHAQNFLDCVKSRQEPNSDLESSHQVSTACHLANLSMKLGRKLRWDADKEQILGDAEANAMLSRPYRQPWDAELKALGLG
ncbi:MAG TPA: Gfo/Idh/MocA family oxidoreductase [Methylomirabilota bacterium]|nr:Gfo/Idh/MocA family oxidoreductase [Methylomirabilota bacterium]